MRATTDRQRKLNRIADATIPLLQNDLTGNFAPSWNGLKDAKEDTVIMSISVTTIVDCLINT